MCEFIINNNEILNNVRETKKKLKTNVKLMLMALVWLRFAKF